MDFQARRRATKRGGEGESASSLTKCAERSKKITSFMLMRACSNSFTQRLNLHTLHNHSITVKPRYSRIRHSRFYLFAVGSKYTKFFIRGYFFAYSRIELYNIQCTLSFDADTFTYLQKNLNIRLNIFQSSILFNQNSSF